MFNCKAQTIGAVIVAGLLASGASADILTWGSISVDNGPTVYDWQIAEWIDEFFEDGSKDNGSVGSKITFINTACYGGDFAENFNGATGDAAGGGAFDTVGFTNIGFVAANSAGKPSYYSGFHDNAAAATTPANDAQDVVNAGSAGKDPRETPVAFGSNHNLSGTTSTHVLVWAGKPNAQDQTDVNNIHNAFTGQANTTVTVLSGNGTGANADGAATLTNLKSALQNIGAMMDDGADESFVFFITDHGNIEKINTNRQLTAAAPLTTPFTLGPDVFGPMVGDPFNNPTIEFYTPNFSGFLPEEISVDLNGNPLGTLADSFFDIFTYPGGFQQGHFTFALPDESLLNGSLDEVTMTYTGADSFFDVFFDIQIGSGDIARLAAIPMPTALPAGLALLSMLAMRRRA